VSELIAALVGSLLTLLGGFAVWALQERNQNKRVRAEKLQELIKAIHRTNLQVLRLDGKYSSEQAEQEMENSINEIEAIVTLHFPEFRVLSGRVYKAFVLSLGEGSLTNIASELRGLEQDLINFWEGSKAVLAPDRPMPKL
jgi:HAMP domain-containing protein